jgi:hypothetical protein
MGCSTRGRTGVLHGMVTKQAPTSLRIPEATRVRVEKWAAEQGIPRNAAYVQLIERGLAAAGPHPGLNERPLKAKAVGAPAQPEPFKSRLKGEWKAP